MRVKLQKPGTEIEEGQTRICRNCGKPVVNNGDRVGIIHTTQLYCCHSDPRGPGKQFVAE